MIFVGIFSVNAVEPGYKLVNGTPKWTPGTFHPNYSNVIASQKKDSWMPAPGYKWANDKNGDFSVKWTPGVKHIFFPNVIAGEKENVWNPAPGYKWLNNNSNDFRVVRNNNDDSDSDNSSEEFTFDCKKCKGSGNVYDFEVRECPKCHGRKKYCSSCKGSGQTVLFGGGACLVCLGSKYETCYTCMNSGTKGVTVKKRCPQCNGRGKISL